MSITYDLTTDVRYKQGREQGRELGEAIKVIIATRNMLKAKVDIKAIALFQDVTVEFVEKIKEELKKETQILKALNVKRAKIDTIAKKLGVSSILVGALKRVQEKKKEK